MYLSQAPDSRWSARQGWEEALRLARDLSPDVVLMDLLMPVMDGIEATRAIKAAMPDVEVVALTSVLEDASVAGAVRAGPSATSSRAPTPTSCAAPSGRRPKEGSPGPRGGGAPDARGALPREPRAPDGEGDRGPAAAGPRAVQRQISAELFIEEKTVKAHVSSVLRSSA